MATDFLFKAGSVVLLLGGLIFVHELGHFLAAKALGVKVLRFSIGFGPRVLGFKRGETEYWIAPLPLGGYVKMAGDDPSEEMAPEDKGRGFFEQRPWRRFLIAAAGPAMNLLFPGLVFFVFNLTLNGQPTAGPVIGMVFPGSPAAQAQLLPGDRIVSVTIPGAPPKRIRDFQEISDLILPRPGVPITLEVVRNGQTLPPLRIVPEGQLKSNPIESKLVGVIGISPSYPAALIAPVRRGAAGPLEPFDLVVRAAGKPVVHFGDLSRVLGENSCSSVELLVLRESPIELPGAKISVFVPITLKDVPTCESGKPTFAPADPSFSTFIASVTPDSPAAAAGLTRGDAITQVNGIPVHSGNDLNRLSGEFKAGRLVRLTLQDGHEVNVVPGETREKDKNTGETVPRIVLGFSLYSLELVSPKSLMAEWVEIRVGPVKAAQMALEDLGDTMRTMVLAIARIFQGRISAKSLGGPIMIAKMTAEAAEKGLKSFLALMAFISINLGLMNLLPIPVLDGGHLMTCMVEAVTRRSLSARAREIANLVGIILLAMLMLLVFKNDIVRLIG